MLNLKKLSRQANAMDIQQAIAHRFADHKYIIFNAYMFDWESDYLSVNESSYVYECEIKVSVRDYQKDFNKKSKHILLENKKEGSLIPNKFFYATPRGLIASINIPEYAGLIEVTEGPNGYTAEVVKNAPFLHREDVFQHIQPKLLDKFYHKYMRTEAENYRLLTEMEQLKAPGK